MRQAPALLWLLLCLALPAAASAEDLYVANSASSSISGFSIGSEGLLSPIECAEKACETEAGPATLAISPNGKYVFVVNTTAGTVSSFAIGAGGALSPVECRKNCTPGKRPLGVATSPNGKYVYVAASGGESIATFSVDPHGALTEVACSPNKSCETPEGEPAGVAVTPNGQFLYATADMSKRKTPVAGAVFAFSIGSEGTLTPVKCAPCEKGFETGVGPKGITIAPSGQYLYVADRGSNTVSAFEVGPTGALSPLACTELDCATGEEPQGATVSPNGKYLFVSNTAKEPPEPKTEPPEPAFVSVFSIGADGALSPIACAGQNCETASKPGGVAVSPEGKFLYAAASGAGIISPFSIGLEGALSPIECGSDCKAGSGEFLQSLAITPDQAPTASFTYAPAMAGEATTFDASASAASPGQSVVSYDWNFGDGSSEETTSPSTSHAYATANTYTVTLTVVDSAACSTEPIFTGQTASCNGSSNAQDTAKVVVPSVNLNLKVYFGNPKLQFKLFGRGSISPTRVKLTLSDVRESATKWREGKSLARISSSRKLPPIGTRFSFDLSQAASVAFTFFKSLPGRRVAKRCVAPSHHNAHAHRCVRSVLAGTLKLAADAGLDTVRFYGLLSSHKHLSPGNYTLVLSGTSASGVHATTTTLHFAIAKPAG